MINMIDFQGILFTMGAIFVAIFLSIFAYIIFRAYSKPAPGLVLGSYEIFGRYAGGKLYESIKGILVDSTAYFLNPILVQDFTKLVLYDVDRMIAKIENVKKPPVINVTSTKTENVEPAPAETAIAVSSNAEQELKKLESPKTQQSELDLLRVSRQAFVDLPFQTACRMLVIRDGIGGDKHLILQVGDTSKSITEFAMHDPHGSGFSFTLGPVRKGVIDGAIQTLPGNFSIFGFGKVKIHIFKPFDPTKADMIEGDAKKDDKGKVLESLFEKFSNLAMIVQAIPNALDVRQHVKSLNEQLKDKDIALEEMSADLTKKAVTVDRLTRAVKGFQTEGGNPVEVTPKNFDGIDVLIIIFGAVLGVGGGIALGGAVGGLAGVIVGLIPSLLVVFKRH